MPFNATDAFVTEIDPSGSALVYSSYLGGGGEDYGSGIAVDAAGNAYVTGVTASPDFPTTPGAFQTTFGDLTTIGRGRVAAFVTKVTAGGSSLAYSTYLGASGSVAGKGIAVDSAGNAFVTGPTTAFLTATPFTFALPNDLIIGGVNSHSDAFVAKLNATGSALADVAYLHGRNTPPSDRFVSELDNTGNGIAVDNVGDAYVTGLTIVADFPTVGPIQPLYTGFGDAFLTKIHPAPVHDARNPRFVVKAYQDLLQQTPDSTAVGEWSLVLDQLAGRDTVALSVIHNNSDYYTLVIDELYQKYLKRAPDPTGIQDDLLFLTRGAGTVEEVEASIIGSVEYFYVRGGGTDQGWENTMYNDVFNRPIDPTGKATIDTSLKKGETRLDIGRKVFASDEFRFDFINGLYMRFLGRPAEQAGINQWLGYMQAGHRDEEVIAGIVGSPEYFGHV
jgi:hypothetical protein